MEETSLPQSLLEKYAKCFLKQQFLEAECQSPQVGRSWPTSLQAPFLWCSAENRPGFPWVLKCQGPQSPGWDPNSWRPPLAQRVKEGRLLRSTQGSAIGRAGLPGPALGLETSLCFSLLAVYRCGSPWGWSRPYGFRALLNGSSWSPRFALFGDMGLENPQSLPRLQREVQQGWYDAVLHIGRLSGCPALRSSLPLTM